MGNEGNLSCGRLLYFVSDGSRCGQFFFLGFLLQFQKAGEKASLGLIVVRRHMDGVSCYLAFPGFFFFFFKKNITVCVSSPVIVYTHPYTSGTTPFARPRRQRLSSRASLSCQLVSLSCSHRASFLGRSTSPLLPPLPWAIAYRPD